MTFSLSLSLKARVFGTRKLRFLRIRKSVNYLLIKSIISLLRGGPEKMLEIKAG